MFGFFRSKPKRLGAAEVQALAERARRRSGQLDYTESSLQVVESLLSSSSKIFGQMNSTDADALVQELGSYILETGRRMFEGQYLWYDATNEPVLLISGADWRVCFMAWSKVRGRAMGDEGDNIPFHFAGLTESAGNPRPGMNLTFV